jgi:hypothetical protein
MPKCQRCSKVGINHSIKTNGKIKKTCDDCLDYKKRYRNKNKDKIQKWVKKREQNILTSLRNGDKRLCKSCHSVKSLEDFNPNYKTCVKCIDRKKKLSFHI